MRVYKIQNVKEMMAKILMQDCFDDFLVSEIKILGKANLFLTGSPAEGFFPAEELDESGYIPYATVRSLCFDMIKGEKQPESFTFMFLLSREKVEALLDECDSTLQPSDVESLSFLVRFKGGELTVTTGSALKIFTMDKSLNVAWEKWVENYLTTLQIGFDEI